MQIDSGVRGGRRLDVGHVIGGKKPITFRHSIRLGGARPGRRSGLLAALVLATATGAGNAAFADEGRAPGGLAAQAQTDAGRAQLDYRRGDFQSALRGYRKAYEEGLDPVNLLGMAKCHARLSEYELAIYFYQGYVAYGPSGPARAEAERGIAEAEAALAAVRIGSPHAAAPVPLYRRAWLWGTVGGVLVAGGVAAGLAFALPGPPLPADSLGTIDAR